MTITVDTPFIAQRPGQSLAEDDADIFDGMVRIDFQVTLSLHRQVKLCVPGQQRQHVVEKADPGMDFGSAMAVQFESDVNFCFLSFAVLLCLTHGPRSPCFPSSVIIGSPIPAGYLQGWS
jgi:hypothetical protein